MLGLPCTPITTMSKVHGHVLVYIPLTSCHPAPLLPSLTDNKKKPPFVTLGPLKITALSLFINFDKKKIP